MVPYCAYTADPGSHSRTLLCWMNCHDSLVDTAGPISRWVQEAVPIRNSIVQHAILIKALVRPDIVMCLTTSSCLGEVWETATTWLILMIVLACQDSRSWQPQRDPALLDELSQLSGGYCGANINSYSNKPKPLYLTKGPCLSAKKIDSCVVAVGLQAMCATRR